MRLGKDATPILNDYFELTGLLRSNSIEKIKNGYNVNCSVSGGDMELMKFSIYVPDIELARIVRKNFHKKELF